jgi:AcrR family transcriptional regulator
MIMGLPAPHFAVTPPLQDRARRTTDRIINAVEDLLRQRPLERITIQEIVTLAGTTTGSFYARFASKDALLPYIYARYDADLSRRAEAMFANARWDRITLAEAVRGRVRAMITAYEERRWLMRAVTLFARTHPEGIPDDVIERRRAASGRWSGIIDRFRDEITHPDPARAFRFAMFMLASTAREAVLFGDAPQARITPGLRESLEDELTRAALGYLTATVHPATPPR